MFFLFIVLFSLALNLGVPKSSVSSSKQSLAVMSSTSSSLPMPSSVHSSHIDGTSSPTILSSYPDLTTPSATPFHASAMLHPPQQTFQTLNATKTQPSMKSVQSGNSSSNTIYKMSSHEQQELQRKASPSPHYHPNSVGKPGGGSSNTGSYAPNNIIGSSRGGGANVQQSNTINMIKQQPGAVAKTMPGMVELSAGYIATTGHQYQPQPPPNKSSSHMKPMKDDSSSRNKPGNVNVLVLMYMLLLFQV